MRTEFDMALAVVPNTAYEGLTKEKILDLIDLVDDDEFYPVTVHSVKGYAVGFISNEMFCIYMMDIHNIHMQIREIVDHILLTGSDDCEYKIKTNGVDHSGLRVYGLMAYISKGEEGCFNPQAAE